MESEVRFIFIRLHVLRKCLAEELKMTSLPFPYDLERAIDDFVFLCLFIGNDFLPHLPSLEIREGAMERLINLYKSAVYKTGGFVTHSGKVDLNRVQVIMTELGKAEDETFKLRRKKELDYKRNQKGKKKRFKPASLLQASTSSAVQNARHEAIEETSPTDALAATAKPADEKNSEGVKRKLDEEEEPFDEVRLWEDGWKDRYYEVKFEVTKDNIAFRHKVAAAYVEGLCWVFSYYYQGCASWKWFFPYHYAPFASDFSNLGDLDIEFEKATEPFKPLEQLMAVLPAESREHVPEPWGKLMLDPESSIIDFYPADFKVDLNGKKFPWQGVALLPFVDDKLLLEALEDVYPLLTDEEKRRNVRGNNRLYVLKDHMVCDYLFNEQNDVTEADLDTELSAGVAGEVKVAGDVIRPEDDTEKLLQGSGQS